ncbi:hypothetical protein [Streptomyces sp. NPDC004286]|uniref:hypothetical protein n=1 Tax=Streptomyces sp. NPDC004286 TaxID=3364696 RepID=UPI0036C043E1
MNEGNPPPDPSPAGTDGDFELARPTAPVGAPAPEAGGAGPADPRTDGTATGRSTPLHDPDPYSTPPYGGPGPWAPAPPVQHPMATPAQGTPVREAPAPVPAPARSPEAAHGRAGAERTVTLRLGASGKN